MLNPIRSQARVSLFLIMVTGAQFLGCGRGSEKTQIQISFNSQSTDSRALHGFSSACTFSKNVVLRIDDGSTNQLIPLTGTFQPGATSPLTINDVTATVRFGIPVTVEVVGGLDLNCGFCENKHAKDCGQSTATYGIYGATQFTLGSGNSVELPIAVSSSPQESKTGGMTLDSCSPSPYFVTISSVSAFSNDRYTIRNQDLLTGVTFYYPGKNSSSQNFTCTSFLPPRTQLPAEVWDTVANGYTCVTSIFPQTTIGSVVHRLDDMTSARSAPCNW